MSYFDLYYSFPFHIAIYLNTYYKTLHLIYYVVQFTFGCSKIERQYLGSVADHFCVAEAKFKNFKGSKIKVLLVLCYCLQYCNHHLYSSSHFIALWRLRDSLCNIGWFARIYVCMDMLARETWLLNPTNRIFFCILYGFM